ncbi:MAG: 4a-hydroxytetrahydrobiopterin dehydratase [Actinobacteria bacterium]|nr:4a-hydroxytetrahydrobiopterin dehydratase [Actinomycetota bacterium]
MTTLTPQQFEEAGGTEGWRALNAGADTWFATRSHRDGAVLVRRVAELAEAAGHHPDIDVRAAGVHLRLFSHDVAQLTERDVSLAREISAAAADLGMRPDPAAVQRMQIAIDTTDAPALAPFWQAAFRFDRVADDRLADPLGRQPRLWFQEMDAPRPLRNRIHLDAGTPWELVSETTTALQSAGGRITYENQWWRTLADTEGNEADVFPLAAEHGTFDDPGAGDWRVMLTAAVHYPTGSFLQGVELLEAVAGLADDAGLPLMLDLRYSGVTVDGGKDQHEAAGFVDLARAVQSAARDLGLVADPRAVRDFQVGIDALDVETVKAFWRAALGYVDDPRPRVHDLYDPRRLNPPVFFQQMDEPREQRNRIHVDLFVPADQAQARVAAAVAAGGRVVYDADAPAWWTLADPEGNELDIAVTVGRAERASLG